MNIIYNASAGTGKTYRVTELYSALVLGRPHDELPVERKPIDPRRILLMTFTDNAASELRHRVAEQMLAAEKTSDLDSSDLARRVLRTLPAANISTIHAFCSGLLREHALEMGLSPNFQIMEDEARETLITDTLKAELFQRLENDPNLRDFCAGISILHGDYSVIETVRSLLEKAASCGIDLSNAENLLPAVEQTITKQDFERIRNELARFGLSQKTVLNALDALDNCLAQFPAGLKKLKKFGRVKAVKHISKELFEIQEKYLSETLYSENIEKLQAFARYIAASAKAFVFAKRSRDAVDFGDQLLLARELLRGGSFKDSFDWIVVDEVQDTSRVQCDLIESLWGNQTNLVVCGDRKQSIYAWRSADPNVMPDLEAAMDARGSCSKIDLKTSYRSKARVIEAVNELFNGIYKSYEPLEPLSSQPNEKPCVEILEADNKEQTSDEEMEAVARRIRLLVEGDEHWRPTFGHNGEQFIEGEPFHYGDILILLKRSTHQNILEKALRTAGIPYTSGGKGNGLFEKQEVRDLLLFLQVLTQPKNDLALVGFMRSPFANLPDNEIVKLGWDGKTFDHEILRKQFYETTSKTAERILRYRALIGTKLPSQLIRELVRETGFDAYWAGQTVGEQPLANFKKALDWLRKTERGGQTLIGDVVRQFEKHIQTPPRSGASEALLPDPEQNAVTLMSVHGAKGLTKRVCFIPDISFGDVTDSGFANLSSNGTLEMNLPSLTGEKIKTPGWTTARETDKTIRKLEQNNVFYVAMTRARDLVILSGAGTKSSNGWKKQAETFAKNASPEILRTLSFAELPDLKKETTSKHSPSTSVTFQPLEIPKTTERRTVTSLCKKVTSTTKRKSSTSNSTQYGTLGHIVLEELAKNNWNGDIPTLVDQLDRTNLPERAALKKQLEAARIVLQKETAGAEALLIEHPFVMKRGDTILDGTIDLLAKFPKGWKIFDYKFSNDTIDTAAKTYSPQLTAYQEAIEKLNPGENVSAFLILIGETVQRSELSQKRFM